jgi:cystathionine beta-synthase
MEHDVDAVVCGVGSGGTITGLARFFASVSDRTEIVLADPKGSILAEYVKTGRLSKELGSWIVEGIGEDFLPDVLDLSRVRKAYEIPDRESLLTARELLQREGILAGSSSGTLIAAALRYCREQKTAKRVVTLVCDSGNKYLSKMFNDYWMVDQGFIEREQKGDLRDLISRRHEERGTVTVSADDNLLIAYGRMKLYDISQLPVLDKSGRVVGIIDESDILLKVFHDDNRFKDPISSAMTSRLETIDAEQPMEALLPIFAKDHVAIVFQGGTFVGLITRIDLLNHLRRRMR